MLDQYRMFKSKYFTPATNITKAEYKQMNKNRHNLILKMMIKDSQIQLIDTDKVAVE